MQIVFQVVSDANFISKIADPAFWQTYKAYCIQELTEGASEVIRQYAASLWKKPSAGGIDQSWYTRYDTARGIGYIGNTKPYAYWQSVGVIAHKMTYLLNAESAWYLADGSKAVTIPLKRDGETIFRVATAKQMMQNPGGPPWWHPGIAPKNIMEKGMELYRQTKLRTDFEGLMIRVLNLTP